MESIIIFYEEQGELLLLPHSYSYPNPQDCADHVISLFGQHIYCRKCNYTTSLEQKYFFDFNYTHLFFELGPLNSSMDCDEN